MGWCLDALVEGDNVRMTKRLEDLDFREEVLLHLALELSQFDGFDGDEGTGALQRQQELVQVQNRLSQSRLRAVPQSRPTKGAPRRRIPLFRRLVLEDITREEEQERC